MAPKAAHLRAAVATSCALAAAAFAAKQWADFGEELRAHLRQAPACCLDGRPASAGVAEARFQVDDFQHDLDAAYGSLNCRFQVFVYPRNRSAPGAADGGCREESLAAARPAPHPRLSYAPAGVFCARPGAWALASSFCDAPSWLCDTGQCTAFERAALRCSSLLGSGPYACRYVPGDAAAGVSEAFAPPAVSGLFALVVSALLAACAPTAALRAPLRRGAAAVAAHLGLVAVTSAGVVSLLLAVAGPEAQGTDGARALEGTAFSGGLVEAVPWQGRVEGSPWRDMLLLAALLFAGYVGLAVLGLIVRCCTLVAEDPDGPDSGLERVAPQSGWADRYCQGDDDPVEWETLPLLQ